MLQDHVSLFLADVEKIQRRTCTEFAAQSIPISIFEDKEGEEWKR